MARICEITGKRPRSGNNVSHSNIKTKRTFRPNLFKKRFYVEELDKWVTIKLCSTALKTINKKGVTPVLKAAIKAGTYTGEKVF